MLHGGKELTEVSFLEKSRLPPKDASPKWASSESWHSQGRGQGAQGGAWELPDRWASDTQTASLAWHSLAERHPGVQDHRPRAAWAGRCSQLWRLPHTQVSGAQKHSWFWGSPHTCIWRCKAAMGTVTAAQVLGLGGVPKSGDWDPRTCGHLVLRCVPSSANCPK